MRGDSEALKAQMAEGMRAPSALKSPEARAAFQAFLDRRR
jgi:hypothetical protein